MSTSELTQARTRMFARALGPFLVILDVTALARTSDMRVLLSEFTANSVWSWVAGAFILLAGLFIIAGHSYWRGPAAIIVSLLGWLIALRGLFLLAFPDTFASVANSMIGAEGWWRAIFVALSLVGLYLTYVGWMPTRDQPTSQAPSSTQDVPRAA